VEYRYMDPDEVLSGVGTAAVGGRFAPLGTLAVYLSVTDSGTGTELLARKARLGGSPQVTLDKYPRVVFGVQVELNRVVDLSTGYIPSELTNMRDRCLSPDALDTSMTVAAELIAARVQALIFPSVVGGTDNLVVYLANCGPGALKIQHANELISKAKRIAAKSRP
jgi:RES domain-containing protein